MHEVTRRWHRATAIRWPGIDIMSRRRLPANALGPLLEAEAQACQSLRAALSADNRRWIESAVRRWRAAHELTERVLGEEAVA
jgi:hypothetical protein